MNRKPPLTCCCPQQQQVSRGGFHIQFALRSSFFWNTRIGCTLFSIRRSVSFMHMSMYLEKTSSETQGRSVGPGEKALQTFSSTGGKAPGYRLSPDHFQTVKRMLAPDWAQKMLCIIVPNRRIASPEFFSRVRTRRLLTRSRLA